METQAVHVKGLEPAGYDPRILKGMGLAYATSNRGACHLRATILRAELSGMIDPSEIEGKAGIFIDFEDRHIIFDCLILCRFFRDLYPWELMGELVNASTGIDGSKENLERIALNVWLKVRAFNTREGLTKEDEKLPTALHVPLEDSGANIEPEELDYMVKDYLAMRGVGKHA